MRTSLSVAAGPTRRGGRDAGVPGVGVRVGFAGAGAVLLAAVLLFAAEDAAAQVVEPVLAGVSGIRCRAGPDRRGQGR